MKLSPIKRILILILGLALIIGIVFAIRACNAPPDFEDIETRLRELIDDSYEVNEIVFGKGLPVYEHVQDPRNSTNVIHTGEFTTNADGDEKERLIYYYYTLDNENKVVAFRDSYLKDYDYALVSTEKLSKDELVERFPKKPDDTAQYYVEIHSDEESKIFCYLIPYEEKKYEFYYTSADDSTYDYVRFDCAYRSVDAIKERIEKVYSYEYSQSLYSMLFDGVESGGKVVTPRYTETTSSSGSFILAQSNNYDAMNIEKRVYLFDTAKINKLSSNRKLVRISINSYVPSAPENITTREITLVYRNGNWFLNSPTI